ncbi:hypothetical protein IW261DRAFT_1577185 [Armillaria novae-zelandiae]|uniref:Uncharacterized protein n=1 Tax=Armillaria novae-zelandiae TaxID=153914 RepID=A0AA39N9E5_9AGAR|nr:hypothetical protein IW261DRAFT_1577185 [Armillaria novae-zelandiae]
MSAPVMTPPQNGSDHISTKRKRSRSISENRDDEPPSVRRRSNSPPPPRSRLDLPRVSDVDPVRRAERERQLAARVAAMELEKAEKPKDKPQ